MSVTTQTCITVACDDCGRSNVSDNEDYDYTPHFTTIVEARATLTDHDWTWRLDEASPMLCRDCTEKAACTLEGHVMSRWRGCACGGKLPTHPDGCGRTVPSAQEFRGCERCSGAHEHRAAS